MHFSISCSTVICSPTVILMLSWEKPLVKPMAPGLFSIILFSRQLAISVAVYFAIFIFQSIQQKYQKIILLSLSDLTFASGREGIDNPFIALVARFLFVCVGTRRLVCSLLLDWYLGSQKLREILTLLCCITLSSSRKKPTQAQKVARRISGVVAGEVYTKPSRDLSPANVRISRAVAGEIYAQVKTYQVPITNSYPSHYIICHLPLVFLSPTSPLPFYSPTFPFPSFSLASFLLVCWIACLSWWLKTILNCVTLPIPTTMVF